MKVIVTRRLPGTVEARLAERFDAELNPGDALFDRARRPTRWPAATRSRRR